MISVQFNFLNKRIFKIFLQKTVYNFQLKKFLYKQYLGNLTHVKIEINGKYFRLSPIGAQTHFFYFTCFFLVEHIFECFHLFCSKNVSNLNIWEDLSFRPHLKFMLEFMFENGPDMNAFMHFDLLLF